MPSAEAKSVFVTGGIAAIAAEKSVGIFGKARDLVGGGFGSPFVIPNHFRQANGQPLYKSQGLQKALRIVTSTLQSVLCSAFKLSHGYPSPPPAAQ